MKTTRKQAAIELNRIYNAYEVRKNSVSTTYQKMFVNFHGNWMVCGKAHDYIL